VRAENSKTLPRYTSDIRIILASASPRRRELLKQLVPDFEVIPSHVDESGSFAGDPEITAKALALAKAAAVFDLYGDALVIGADTVVARQEQPGLWKELGKPADSEDARRMLTELSGRTHVVVTGIAVIRAGFSMVAADATRVTFRDIAAAEIEEYVAGGEPSDKAGAYAIQGGARSFVERVEGSISNVVGLPIEVLGPILAAAGIALRNKG
jgi:septum formation protein